MRTLSFVAAGVLAWIALRGSWEPATLVAGLVLAWTVARLQGVGRPGRGPRAVGAGGADRNAGWGHRRRRPLRAALAILRLVAAFCWEVAVSNLAQLRLVLAPRLRLRPMWIPYETALDSPRLRTLLALMISMTPGTLTCDLAGRTIWIHVLDADGEGAARRRIRRRLESPLLVLETP